MERIKLSRGERGLLRRCRRGFIDRDRTYALPTFGVVIKGEGEVARSDTRWDRTWDDGDRIVSVTAVDNPESDDVLVSEEMVKYAVARFRGGSYGLRPTVRDWGLWCFRRFER